MHPTSRPSSASAAVHLAYATAGVSGAAAIAVVAHIAGGGAGTERWLVLLLSLLCLAGLVLGAELPRRRLRRSVLVASAIVTAAAIGVTSLSGFVAYDDSVFVAFAAAPLFLVPLPIVAAALAGSHAVGDWLSGGGRRASGRLVDRP